MITQPHQFEDDQHNNQPTKPKRNRVCIVPSTTRLQTTDLDTRKGRNIGESIVDDSLSPRAAVSARFGRLDLHSSLSPTRRTTRRSSWTINQEPRTQALPCQNSDEAGFARDSHEPDSSTTDMSQALWEEKPDSAKHDVEHAMFEFAAGTASTSTNDDRASFPSPSKRPRLDTVQDPATPSPSKRRRQHSASPLPTPIPRAQSPSARKLPAHKKRISESSQDADSDSDMDEAELAQFWWQPSEITGHDPADPEDDDRGVNGIGYQKTKQEAWQIGEQRKKQIVEWRNREAKEARALRAGGRRTLMGRVSKASSRAGSPVEMRGRSSPRPKSAGGGGGGGREEVTARAVRFDVG